MDDLSLEQKIKKLANSSVRVKELEEQVGELKREVNRLQTEINKLEVLRNNEAHINLVKEQIGFLREKSDQSELTFEDVKKLDVLFKNLLLLQGADKSKKGTGAINLSDDELLAQLKSFNQ